MFGFLKRKKKQDSDQQDALESQTSNAEGQKVEEETKKQGIDAEVTATKVVQEHDPEAQQSISYEPDALERDAAREALDDSELVPGEAHSALDEIPVETPREELAHEVSRPEENTPPLGETRAENAVSPDSFDGEKDEIKEEVLAQAAAEAHQELREQDDNHVPHDVSATSSQDASASSLAQTSPDQEPGQKKPRSEKQAGSPASNPGWARLAPT